jgi:hypothetical protein
MNAFDKYHDFAARLIGKKDFPLPLPKMDKDYPHNVGLLSDAEESELTAKVLNHTNGMTLDVWSKLGLEQRIPWLRIAIDNLQIGGDVGREIESEIRLSLSVRAGSENRYVDADEVRNWPPGMLDQLLCEGVLSQTKIATSVACNSCGEDHVELVEYIKSPLDSVLRAYISCPALGRVTVPLDRLRRWAITREEASVLPEDPSRITTFDEPLNERAQSVLVAMVELGAVDSDNRKPTVDIAAKALGSHADSNALKTVMADLNTREYVLSKSGRGGGCWLTDKGRARAEKLRH